MTIDFVLPTTGSPRRAISWLPLTIGFVVTLLVALSVHAVMLDVLGAPYPDRKVDAPFFQFVSRSALHALGLIFLDAAIGNRFKFRGMLTRIAVLFVLACMLTESLMRQPFMDGYCTNAFVVAFASAIPRWVAELCVVAMIVVARSRMTTLGRRIVGALIVGAVSTFALDPLAAGATSSVQQALAAFSGNNWCELPYGWNINVPAYLTFAEPVVAAFAMAFFAWQGLSSQFAWRLFQFTLLIVLIRRQLLAAFIYMAWSGLPALTGLAAMGQFSLEAVALGLLSGLAWRWATKE